MQMIIFLIFSAPSRSPDDLFPADLTIRGSVLCYNGTSFRVDALGQNQTRALLFLCQVSFGLFLRLAWNMAS